MSGKFYYEELAAIDLNDQFFDSLKLDYPGNETTPSFEKWYTNKAKVGRTALIFRDDQGLGAFICVKHEAEPVALLDRILPPINRCKISTIKIADRFRGQRLGEGAIGLVLWGWQRSGFEEIYVTVFDKHDSLIMLLERFGFEKIGYNLNQEGVYIRSRRKVDYSDPFKSFPFINPNFQNSGYLIINDNYHDTMFPYSELKNTLQQSIELNVRNGLSKIYVGAQYSLPPYKVGDPILIYRKYNGDGPKKYKSCITSFCIVTNIIIVKQFGKYIMTFNELLRKIGNKSVFDQEGLKKRFDYDTNMMVIEMLYYGFFGEGNNVNQNTLKSMGAWCESHDVSYPTQIRLRPEEFKRILQEGNVDVNNVIIN